MTTQIATDTALIAHLLRRAGFGAPAHEVERYAELGYDATVDHLLNVEKTPRLDEDLLERFHLEHSDEESPKWSGKRWVWRMIATPRPLEEKVALMWHNRFATGYGKVPSNRLMRTQLDMLRDHGMGNFADLLKRLSRDPAMIYWLDQQQNHATAVNENYGRELLELFSMGRGNYTEDDVRSAARAFTGWTIDQVIPRYPTGYYLARFVYREEDHDHGQKTFLGETGDFNGDDIVDIIVKQPATGRFVANEIYKTLVSDEPDGEAIEILTQVYFESGYDIREMLRATFHSDFFKEARWKKIKSPAEVVAGTMRLAGQHADPYEFGLSGLAKMCMFMGQELLNPPTVEGWHTGREWIDSSFLIERVNFAADRLGNVAAPGIRKMIDRMSEGRSSMTADELIDACLYELGCLEIGPRTREVMLDTIGADRVFDCRPQDREQFESAAAQVFQLIAATREYQLA